MLTAWLIFQDNHAHAEMHMFYAVHRAYCNLLVVHAGSLAAKKIRGSKYKFTCLQSIMCPSVMLAAAWGTPVES